MTDTKYYTKLDESNYVRCNERFSGGLWILEVTNRGTVDTEIIASSPSLHRARLCVLRKVKEREACRK